MKNNSGKSPAIIPLRIHRLQAVYSSLYKYHITLTAGQGVTQNTNVGAIIHNPDPGEIKWDLSGLNPASEYAEDGVIADFTEYANQQVSSIYLNVGAGTYALKGGIVINSTRHPIIVVNPESEEVQLQNLLIENDGTTEIVTMTFKNLGSNKYKIKNNLSGNPEISIQAPFGVGSPDILEVRLLLDNSAPIYFTAVFSANLSAFNLPLPIILSKNAITQQGTYLTKVTCHLL